MSPDRAAVRALLDDVVRAYSPSGEEAGAAVVVVEHLAAWGLDVRTDGVGNVVAHGGGDGPHVVLLGHLDTVPGELPVRWQGDTLWGRGTVDAKGPLVAHAAALAALGDEGPRVTLVGAVGEEATSPGAHHLASRLRPDALVIAEPTGLATVGLGYKGCLKGTLTARATPAHPGSGHPTASERLVAAIEALTAWTGNPGRDPGFGERTLRVVALESEHTADVDLARARIDLRLPGPVPAPGTLEGHLGEGVSLDVDEALGAVQVDRRDPVATALRSALLARGHEPRSVVKTGSSDWNVVAPHWACPGAAYGPGDSALDHTPDEHVALDEVVEAAAVLSGALRVMEKRWARAAALT